MENRITHIVENFKSICLHFFETPEKSLQEAERYFKKHMDETVSELMRTYYEQLDQQLLADKQERRQRGLLVERRGDRREVLTTMGVLHYQRTYYRTTKGGYQYPVDIVMGLQPYQRVSTGVCDALVEAACRMSYANSSQWVTGGQVSRQTVLEKVRKSSVPPWKGNQKKTHPAALHIDADEDHVT